VKKIIILFALQFASIRFYAQQNNLVPLSNEFNRCLEFSGLTIIHGKFYLLAEKCHVLVSNDNNKPDTIDLSKLVAGDAQLEGITMKNDTAFLIDEKKPAVYAYCVSSKKKIEVALKGIDLDGYTGNRGIEGIAMHPAGKFLYIARENDGNSQSEMLTFSITSQNDKLILNFIDRTFIKHEDKRTRIADIYYVPGKNQLYAIISTYDKA